MAWSKKKVQQVPIPSQYLTTSGDFVLPDDYKELDEEKQNILKELLSDQEWRLEHLYYITNENGEKMLFKMKPPQKFLFRHRWFWNLILKARQLGMTTFISIFFLDSVLFSENQSALIIAHTLQSAREIFDTKIKFAFDNMPPWLREQFQVDTDNIYQLKFRTNGGSIAVSTSGRSSTVQFLHVSEFGIICARWPEKAVEIATGAFQTIHKGNLVFVESTAKGRSGKFYDYCMQAMADAAAGKKLSMEDWKFFFFPWWEDPKYVLPGEFVLTKEMKEYFDVLEKKNNIPLTREQKHWYVKKAEKLQEDMYAEFPSIPEEAFKASIEGAYYSKQMNAAYAEKRITQVPHDKGLLVYTFWDLGVGDEMAIWFVQFYGNQIRLIDLHHASGEGLHQCVAVLQQKSIQHGYVYGGHYAPHDIEVREMGNENVLSRKQIAASLGLQFMVVRRAGIDVGIDEARAMFNLCWFDEEKCDYGIRSLQEYRKKYDEKSAAYLPIPMKSWANHASDAFRMLAMSYKNFVGGNTQSTRVRDPDEIPIGEGSEDDMFDRFSPTGGAF